MNQKQHDDAGSTLSTAVETGRDMRNNRIISEMKLLALRQVLVIALLNIAIMVAAGQSRNTTKGVLSGDRSLDQQPLIEDTQDALKLTTDLVNVVVTVTDRS